MYVHVEQDVFTLGGKLTTIPRDMPRTEINHGATSDKTNNWRAAPTTGQMSYYLPVSTFRFSP